MNLNSTQFSICGTGGWEKLLPWSAPGSAPACFYDVCLIPVLLILAVALGACKDTQPATIRSCRGFCSVYLGAIICSILIHLALLGLGVMRSIRSPDSADISGLLADSQLCFAWISALFSLVRTPGFIPSSGLRLWLLAAASVETLRAAVSVPWSLSWYAWTAHGLDALLLVAAMTAAVITALAGLLQRSEPFPVYDPLGDEPPPVDGFKSPLAGASWASVLGIGWVWPILKVGLERPLTQEAFYCLMDKERPVHNRCSTLSLWSTRVSRWLARHPEDRHCHTGPGASSTYAASIKKRMKRPPSLARVLHDTHAAFFWSSGLLKIISCVNLMQPVFLKALVDFTLTEPSSASLTYGISLCGSLVAVATLASLTSNHYNLRMSRLGIRIRGGLCLLVYEKVMKLHSEELASRGSGQIASLLSIDINNLSWAMPTVHELWCIPLQLAICIYVLYKQIQWASFTGLCVMLIMTPPNMMLMKTLFRNQRKIMSTRDLRIKLLTEIMGSIRAVKLMSWEGHLMDKICEKRDEEVRHVRNQAIAFSTSGFMWLITPVMVSTLSFAVFCLTGGILTAPKAFAALSVFSILRGPLTGLPRVVQLLAQSGVALQRLESFLLSKEVAERSPNHASTGSSSTAPSMHTNQADLPQGPQLPMLHDPSLVPFTRCPDAKIFIDADLPLISVKEGSFKWGSQTTSNSNPENADTTQKKRGCLPCCGDRHKKSQISNDQPLNQPLLAGTSEGQADGCQEPPIAEAPLTLSGINLEVKAAELVAVVGTVGAGKSSLLSAILNDISCESGSVCLSGRVAYCPQQPWIMNDSVRSNILFGCAYEEDWYQTVVKACQLEPDLQMLPGRDMAEIGERGLNLSGGQKARVSLARAVYCRPDVVLLDDVLSAVDVHVAAALLQFCILSPDLLGHAARVVVSHQLHWIGSADRVIVMESGKISATGTAEELASAGLLDYKKPLEAGERKGGLLSRFRRRRRGKVVAAESVASTSTSTFQGTSNASTSVATSDVARMEDLDGVLEEKKGDKEAQHREPQQSQQLVVAEDREEGAVSSGIWILYLRQLGAPWVAAFVACLFFSQFAQILGDATLALWTSGLSRDPTSGHLGPLALYASASILSVTIMYLRGLVLVAASVRASKRVHNAALWRVLRAPLAWLDTTPNGRIINRFQSDQQRLDLMLPASVGNVLGAAAAMAGAVAVVCVTAPVAILLLPPVGILYARYQAVYRASSREVVRLTSLSSSKLQHFFGETLQGCSTVRAFGLQECFIAKFVHRIEDYNRPFFIDRTIDKWLALRLDALGNSSVAIAALYGVVAHCLGVAPTSSSAVGLSLTYSFSLTSMLSMLLMSFAFAENSLVSMERLHSYAMLPSEPKLRGDAEEAARRRSLELARDSRRHRNSRFQKQNQGTEGVERRMRRWSFLCSEQGAHDIEPPADVAEVFDPPGWPLTGDLEFQSVSMRYRPGLDLVLRDLTFKAVHGKHIGIVGRTGAGKSSLLGVLFRLVEIESGTITLNGRDIRSVGLHTLRSAMSIIPQDPVLFSGTMRFNLDPWDSHTDESLHTCLRRVGLQSLVEERGEGLAMAIGPNGDNLSVGQRQLLCMARALLRNTRVVVLDEATASIDSVSDAAIQKTLSEDLTGATVLTIAHRINTVMAYDEVMVMASGQVAEMGPPRDLANCQSSIFHGLYKAARAQGQDS